jgi:uncharacterized protein
MDYVLITGASSGLGSEFAKQLAKDGYNLIIVARRKDRLDKLKLILETQYEINIKIFRIDLSKISETEKLIKLIEKEKLNIKFLINNAGFGYKDPFEKIDKKIVMDMINVNISSLTLLTHHYFNLMKNQGGGKIINVASVAGFVYLPYMAEYAATKAYVISLSQALAEEGKEHNILVSTLCPGPTRTEFGATAHSGEMHLPEFVWTTSHRVVSESLKSVSNNKTICIPLKYAKPQAVLNKFFPNIIAKITGKFLKSTT